MGDIDKHFRPNPIGLAHIGHTIFSYYSGNPVLGTETAVPRAGKEVYEILAIDFLGGGHADKGFAAFRESGTTGKVKLSPAPDMYFIPEDSSLPVRIGQSLSHYSLQWFYHSGQSWPAGWSYLPVKLHKPGYGR